MLLTNVPLFPRKQLVLGLASVAILFGVQFQPRPVPRHGPSNHCQYAATTKRAPLPGHCQRHRVDERQVQVAEEISFGGIGSYVAADPNHEDRFTVVEPLKGTPAFEAGLQPGDVIEKIDGRESKGMPVEQSVSMIRGAEGTVVHLNVFRPSTDSRFELDITRATIHAPLPPAAKAETCPSMGGPSHR